jgi:hypothetical protein
MNDVVVYFKGPHRHCFVDTKKQYKDNEQQHKYTAEQYKDNKEQQTDSEKRYKDNEEHHTDLSYDSNRPEIRIRYFHRNTIHH